MGNSVQQDASARRMIPLFLWVQVIQKNFLTYKGYKISDDVLLVPIAKEIFQQKVSLLLTALLDQLSGARSELLCG
jgi:hypothetical protein